MINTCLVDPLSFEVTKNCSVLHNGHRKVCGNFIVEDFCTQHHPPHPPPQKVCQTISILLVTVWNSTNMKSHHFTWRSFAAASYVTHALNVASSACSFSIVPWTLFRPWTLYQPWTPWSSHSRKLTNIYQNTYIVLHTYNSFTHIYLINLLYKIVSHTFLGGVVGGTEIP